MSEKCVFVFVNDGGCEGWGAPFQAAASEDEAKALWGTMKNSGAHCTKVFEVPVWPAVNSLNQIWVKPVDWCLEPSELERKRKEEARIGGSQPT